VAPQTARDREREQREHRHVESRDRDEMRGAGGVENPPLVETQAVGQSDRERDDEGRRVRIGDGLVDACRDPGPRGVDRSRRQRSTRIELRRQHAAGEMHAVAKGDAREIDTLEVARFRERRQPDEPAPPLPDPRHRGRVPPGETRSSRNRIVRAVDDAYVGIETQLGARARGYVEHQAFDQKALVRGIRIDAPLEPIDRRT
jgi:hypothetical protein